MTAQAAQQATEELNQLGDRHLPIESDMSGISRQLLLGAIEIFGLGVGDRDHSGGRVGGKIAQPMAAPSALCRSSA